MGGTVGGYRFPVNNRRSVHNACLSDDDEDDQKSGLADALMSDSPPKERKCFTVEAEPVKEKKREPEPESEPIEVSEKEKEGSNGAYKKKDMDMEQPEYYDPELAEKEREKGNECFKQQKYPDVIKRYTKALRRNPKESKSESSDDTFEYYPSDDTAYPENSRSSSSQVRGNDTERMQELADASMDRWEKGKRVRKKPKFKPIKSIKEDFSPIFSFLF